MPRQTNTTAKKGSKIAPGPKPFCQHCANIGKPESVVNSHWIRASPDPASPVVCPELLNTECTYCFKLGHTAGRCPVLEDRKKAEKVEERRKLQIIREAKIADEAKALVSATPKKPKINSRFAVLDSSDDEDEQVVVTKVTKKPKVGPVSASSNKPLVDNSSFPSLGGSSVSAKQVVQGTMSYAGMAAKTQDQYQDEQYLKENMKKRVEMPKLERSQKMNEQVQAEQDDDFWKGFDDHIETEEEYAVRMIEENEALELHNKKLFALKGSNMNWASMIDSDDEDW